MTPCSGYASLVFAESAGLAFARALDLAETEAYQDYLDAWVIEDRRITFALDGIASRPGVEGTKRLLSALVTQAISGEAMLDTKYERWARKVSAANRNNGYGEVTTGQTIRMGASSGIEGPASLEAESA